MYRLSTVNGSSRFEQIGQGWVKHSFCALQLVQCYSCPSPQPGGCPPALGSGCADPYCTGLNLDQGRLGARSFVNPFTAVYPSNAVAGFGNTAISRRIQIFDADLMSQPAGTIFYAEGQYVHPGDSTSGNQWNNVSYRRFNVTGPNGSGTFTFSGVGGTIIETPAVAAWTGSVQVTIDPTPGSDGRGILAYQVTDLSGNGSGPWHYEYGVYNMNNEAAFRSFSIPLPANVNISNVGFHHPQNHDPQNTGGMFSNTPWPGVVAAGSISWQTDTFAANQNANAIRWGTLYNFRFDADTPPQLANATLGLYKSGGSTNLVTLGPSAGVIPNCPGDLDGDGDTDLSDLGILLAAFGVNGNGDLDGDGDTDLSDLGVLLADFGCV
jgi:hypothetical protein